MKSFLIKQIRLIAPPHALHNKKVDILIEAGKIKQIEKAGGIPQTKADQVFEEPGTYISPGWFDMHVNLSDPGYEYKESFTELSEAALKGGFTGILCYPNTAPVVDNSQILRSLMQQSQALPVDFYFTGALSMGIHGKDLAELFEMNQAGARAFSDGDHPIQDAGLLLRALQYTQSFNGLLIDCPLDLSLKGQGQMHEGNVSTSLGMKGIPSLSETLALSRQLQLLEYAPSRFHIQPISTPESVAMITAAKKKHKELSVGTSISYLHFNDEALESFDANYKLFPPLRPKKAVKQLQKALQKGQIDVISSGHQAQGLEEKNLQFEQAEPGMLSIQTCYSQANKHLIQTGIMNVETWIEMISYNPRNILNLEPLKVEIGEEANLTIFNPETSWTLQKSHIPSRAKNSPHIGQIQHGKVLGVCKNKDFFDLR